MLKCPICREEMPEKSYCTKFHKELEILWDGNVEGGEVKGQNATNRTED